MATKAKVDWIGKRVRINGELLDRIGDPHLQAGKEGTVLSRNPTGSLVVDCEGSPLVLHPDDLVVIVEGPRGEGIHTAESSNIALLNVREIQPSPFNPRTEFPAESEEELVASIRAVGVMQPILVRPITMPLDPGVITHYEIIFGHRRFRAAQRAGLGQIPAMVRPLPDKLSAQLQQIENLHREDLDAIDEAKGFAAYIAEHKVTKDELATQIGKSRTHVYNRLKLATLGPAGAKAYREGKITAVVATLIARVDGEKHQAKALELALEHESGYGEKRSFRRIREDLAGKFATALKDAKWALDDAELVPLAGACTTCPKRSGASPELYSDFIRTERNHYGYGDGTPSGENVCTDIDCYAAKKTAHLKREQDALEAKGKTVVAGNKARAAIDAQGNLKGAFIALKDVKDALGEAAKVKQKGAKAAAVNIAVVTIQDPRTGKTVEAVKREDLKAAGVKVKETPKQASWEEQQKARHEAHKKEEVTRTAQHGLHLRILEQVRAASTGVALDTWFLQRVARLALEGVEYRSRGTLCDLYQAKNSDGLAKRIGSMADADLRKLLIDCVLIDQVHVWGNKPESLFVAAKHLGVNVGAIISGELATPPADEAANAKKSTSPPAAQRLRASTAVAKKPARAAQAADTGALRAEDGDKDQAPRGADEEEGAALAARGLHPQSAWPFPKGAAP
ncbi:ParB/RepB/Spo0J family partition protein [Variovorax sp. RCC_210]|uniref:ParB/RepB/Spo0J family partition protein n=1 Tax=Variovorax sp. RCC_210 TaxID=3239217 RepID=UPI003523E53B